MKKLLESIKESLRPDFTILKKIDFVVENINSQLKLKEIKAVCVKGGSTAKGTFLKGDYDVDLFVRFDYSLKKEFLSDLLEPVLKIIFSKIQRVHGSRDYFQTQKHDLVFEIVPVLEINDYKKALNVTDMSPLHVDYVNKKISDKQRDDIRLAKQFCKSAKVYGAESYIKGFSGHILDLLIMNYGSFEELIKAVVDWKPKVVIDLEKHLKNPLKELDSAKTHSPLIIIDPVQPCRNAAAALSKEKFDRFIERCKRFLANPSEEFFKIKSIEKRTIRKKLLPNEEMFFITTTPLEGKKDVVGAKIMKVYEYLKINIKKKGFTITKTEWEFKEKGFIYFIVKKEKLSEIEIFTGPPLKEKEGIKRFKEKHVKIFEENDRIYAEEKRKYRKAKELIKDLMKSEYVKERVKKIKLF